MEEKSIAFSIVEDYKKSNKRKDIMIFFLLGIVFTIVISIVIGVAYIIDNYNFDYEENYAETDTGNACVGNNCSNGDEYYGESIQ